MVVCLWRLVRVVALQLERLVAFLYQSGVDVRHLVVVW
jgi:hypothetical protein